VLLLVLLVRTKHFFSSLVTAAKTLGIALAPKTDVF